MLLSWKMSESDEWIPCLMIEPFRIDILQFAGLTFIFWLDEEFKIKAGNLC